YPSDVAGMVLVDARHEDVDARVGPAAMQAEIDQVGQFRGMLVALRRFGITRALGPWLAAAAPPEISSLPAQYFLFQGTPEAAEANVSEIRAFAESARQGRA